MTGVPALLERAVAGHRAGDLAAAETLYRRILEMQPDNPDALHLLGILATQSGRPGEAVPLLRRVTGQFPGTALYWFSLGTALKADGTLTEAVDAFERALRLTPNDADTLCNLGATLNELGRFDEARSALERALSVKPDMVPALNNLGSTLAGLRRLDEAAAVLRRALAMDPDSAEGLTNLGNVLKDSEHYDEAVAAYVRALGINPRLARTAHNLGLTLKEAGRLDEAVAAHDRALAVDPRFVEAWTDRGTALREQGRHAEAEASYLQALAIDPGCAEAHWNRAHPLLILERYDEGWAEYEWRWRVRNLNDGPRDFPQPEWDGSPLDGRTIFLHAEQGWGDAIQFIRYAAPVKALGGTVVVECRPAVRRLLENAPGVDAVVGLGAALPDCHVHAPLLSLPRILGTTTETIPADTPYLSVPEGAGGDLPIGPGFSVGLVWAGSPTPRNNLKRTMPLETLRDVVATEGCRFYSLQVGPRRDDLAGHPWAAGIVDLAPCLRDFADTAAAIDRLDLVISVDTAVAHLAGALGKPCWTLLPFVPDWRWLLDRDDSPWYPTMRLFRQRSIGDWDDVVARVKAALVSLPRDRP